MRSRGFPPVLVVFCLIIQHCIAESLGNDAYTSLRNALVEYVKAAPDDRVSPLVRMSFHDLNNFNRATHQGGPQGCLLAQSVLDFPLNKGLSSDVIHLHDYVVDQLPNSNFSFGDVISLAGKVAVEFAYPCIQVKWRFGRKACNSTNFPPSAPAGTFNTLAQFQPFLVQYGMSAYEMAILTAGSHGIATAAAAVENSGFGDFDFGEISSGKHWILNSLERNWTLALSSAGNLQYEAPGDGTTIMRLPSDLVFFPSIVKRVGGGVPVDTTAIGIQNKLRKFSRKQRSVFDAEFARIYAEMLEIGVDSDTLKDFHETTRKPKECQYS